MSAVPQAIDFIVRTVLRELGEETTNKIKLILGLRESGRIGDFSLDRCLLSGYGATSFDLPLAYENAGVSADWRRAVLK